MDRYDSIKIFKDKFGRRYKGTIIYPIYEPTDDDYYIYSKPGDTYTLLAYEFYGDVDYWFVIASVNNLRKDTMFIEPGKQILIPSDPDSYLQKISLLNELK